MDPKHRNTKEKLTRQPRRAFPGAIWGGVLVGRECRRLGDLGRQSNAPYLAVPGRLKRLPANRTGFSSKRRGTG
jgi:hypothetical protein